MIFVITQNCTVIGPDEEWDGYHETEPVVCRPLGYWTNRVKAERKCAALNKKFLVSQWVQRLGIKELPYEVHTLEEYK